MKLAFAVILTLLSTSVRAEIASYEDYQSQMASPQCLSNLTETLHTLTHPSRYLWVNPLIALPAHTGAKAIRSAVLNNLSIYDKVASEIRSNLSAGVSNEAIYQWIIARLDQHARTPIGKPISNCIRSQLVFTGSKEAQLKNVLHAQQLITQLKKAVN